MDAIEICVVWGSMLLAIVAIERLRRTLGIHASKHAHTPQYTPELALVSAEHYVSGLYTPEAMCARALSSVEQQHRYEFCKYLIMKGILTDELPEETPCQH